MNQGSLKNLDRATASPWVSHAESLPCRDQMSLFDQLLLDGKPVGDRRCLKRAGFISLSLDLAMLASFSNPVVLENCLGLQGFHLGEFEAIV